MNKGDNDKEKEDKATAKTVRLRENVWIIVEQRKRKIPEENASYG